eukprot:226620-Karenia_brevis.AAC.1
MHSVVTLTPDPTPTEAASPFLVPSNTEPEPEDVKDEKLEVKDDPMTEDVKDESGGAFEPSAPPKQTTTNPMSSG